MFVPQSAPSSPIQAPGIGFGGGPNIDPRYRIGPMQDPGFGMLGNGQSPAGSTAGNLFSNPAFQDMIWKYGLGMGMGGMGGGQQRPMPQMPQAMPMPQPQFQPMQRAMLGGR